MKNKLLFVFLAILGFAGCDGQRVEYGVPTAQFTIKGRVTDVSGTPVKGIQVRPDKLIYYNPDRPEDEPREDRLYNSKQGFTDEAGAFEVSGSCFDLNNIPVLIEIEDVDGQQNGGEFSSLETVVEIKPEDQTGKGSWTTTYLKQVDDIVITLKEE